MEILILVKYVAYTLVRGFVPIICLLLHDVFGVGSLHVAGRSLPVLHQQPQQTSYRHDQNDDDAPRR